MARLFLPFVHRNPFGIEILSHILAHLYPLGVKVGIGSFEVICILGWDQERMTECCGEEGDRNREGVGRCGIHDKCVPWVRVHGRQLGKAVHKPFIFKQR